MRARVRVLLLLLIVALIFASTVDARKRKRRRTAERTKDPNEALPMPTKQQVFPRVKGKDIPERDAYLSSPTIDSAVAELIRGMKNYPHPLTSHTPADLDGYFSKFLKSAPELVRRCEQPVKISTAARVKGKLGPSIVALARAKLKVCGFVQLENAYDPAILASVLESGLAAVSARNELIHTLRGTNRIELTLPFEPPFNTSEFMDAPAVMPIVAGVLDGHYKLDMATMLVTLPETDGHQEAHSDMQAWHTLYPSIPPERLPGLESGDTTYAVSVSIPLVEVSPTNGPLHLCPGTHTEEFHHDYVFSKFGHVPEVVETFCRLPSLGCGPLGSVWIYDMRIIHWGGENLDSKLRPVAGLQFVQSWFDEVGLELSPEESVHRDLYAYYHNSA